MEDGGRRLPTAFSTRSNARLTRISNQRRTTAPAPRLRREPAGCAVYTDPHGPRDIGGCGSMLGCRGALVVSHSVKAYPKG